MTQLAKYIYSQEASSLQSIKSNNETQVSVTHPALFSQVTPLFYAKRVQLTFHVSSDLRQFFALIKGMIEFHRTNRFQFRYERSEGTLETDIAIDRLEALQGFLEDLDHLIRKEIEFKLVLKEVISFERNFKSTANSIYGSLMTAARS